MRFFTKSVDYKYHEITDTMRVLCQKHPVLEQFKIGKSCSERDIRALKINSSRNEYVLFTAAFHGSEHITSNILLFFAEELASAYSKKASLAGVNIKKALSGRGIIFVPAVNPDGCEISICGVSGCGKYASNIYKLCGGDFARWNANLRGVDINHNFDAGWQQLHTIEQKSGILGPAPTRFGGYSPESEPETQALVKLCREYNICHAIAIHSQGEVIYWNYNGYEPKKSKQMAEIMAATSGYALDVPVKIATGGGFKDWFLKEFNRPAFTVEVGLGKNPLPISDAFKIYENIREMLTISSIM